jgi:hypothetical protein
MESHLRTSPAVRPSMSSDGLVLLDVRGGVILASNAIGARIWQLVEQGHTASEIAHRLAEDYGVGRERVRCDVDAFLAALIDRGLLIGGEPC